jgi:hypothetical protein
MEKIKRGVFKGVINFGAVVISVPLILIHFVSGALIGILAGVGERNTIKLGDNKNLVPDDIDLDIKE